MREQFTQEEANEILLRAIERQPFGRSITREELASIAAEIGVSSDALRAAEERWAVEHLRENDERRVFREVQHEGFRARIKFVVHLCVFLLIAPLMIAANIEEGPPPIALAFVIPWLIGLVFHGVHTSQSTGVGHERAFRKWQKARRMNDRLDAEDLHASGLRRLVR